MTRWIDYAKKFPAMLAEDDVAEVNLAVTEGMTDEPSRQAKYECIERLDQCAPMVRYYTAQRMPEFHANSAKWNNSEGIYRFIRMIDVIQKVFGVYYNLEKVPDDAPFETADSFIHGAILGKGGTCASLPVVYAAVGRRLGYPIKLVRTRGQRFGHQFCRWDEPGGERFNFEANNHSRDAPSDDYYRTGMYQMTPQEEKDGCFLRSMSPREELAGFLVQRGWRFRDVKDLGQATAAFAWAWQLAPEDHLHKGSFYNTLHDWHDELERRKPQGFPEFRCTRWYKRVFTVMPQDVEENLNYLAEIEHLLNDPTCNELWWQPMRKKRRPASAPYQVLVEYHEDGTRSFDIRAKAPPPWAFWSRGSGTLMQDLAFGTLVGGPRVELPEGLRRGSRRFTWQ